MGTIAGFLSMLGWGTADFLGAKATRKIGNILTLLWMQIIGFFIAFIYFLANFFSFNIANISKFLIILAITGFLQMVAYLSFYKGFEKGQVSLVAPLSASYVMITVILSLIFFKEILAINQAIAIILIISGIILLSIDIKLIKETKKLSAYVGVKEGLITMISWGISMFLVIFTARALGWFLPIFLFRFFLLLFLVIYIFIGKQSFRVPFQPSLLALLLPIGLLDIGAFFTYSFGAIKEHALIVAPIAASYPLVTIILARVFLKEKPALNQIFGIAGVIIGLILISI